MRHILFQSFDFYAFCFVFQSYDGPCNKCDICMGVEAATRAPVVVEQEARLFAQALTEVIDFLFEFDLIFDLRLSILRLVVRFALFDALQLRSATLTAATSLLRGKKVKGKEFAESKPFFGKGKAQNKAFWTEVVACGFRCFSLLLPFVSSCRERL